MIKFEPLQTLKFREFRNLILGDFLWSLVLECFPRFLHGGLHSQQNLVILKLQTYAIGIIGLSEVIPAVSMALYAGLCN